MAVYCEALGFQLVNVISNFAVLIAAYFAYQVLLKNNIRNFYLRILTLFIALVGIGSMLWHAFPNPLTNLADVLPLSVAILLSFYFLLSKVVSSGSLRSIILFNFVLIQAPFVSGLFYSFNGFIPYTITLAAFVVLFWRFSKKYGSLTRQGAPVLVAFGVALVFRTVDLSVCPVIGIGTHFLWQIFIALTFYLTIRFFIKIEQASKIKVR